MEQSYELSILLGITTIYLLIFIASLLSYQECDKLLGEIDLVFHAFCFEESHFDPSVMSP